MSEDVQDAAFFKALAHPTRVQIVRELLHGRRCVSEVEHCLGVSQANVSQHLGILRTQGIVACKHEGSTRCYYLTNPGLMEALFKILQERQNDK